MGSATRIFTRRFEVECAQERLIVVYIDLYKLPEGYPKAFPEGYRFSWIALDPLNKTERVLFDCHSPKGPHVHIDGDTKGEAFQWTSLDSAFELFFTKVKERFGDFVIKG